MKLIFATQNVNKATEIAKLLPNRIEIISLSDLGHTAELEETAETLEGNAIQKANFIYKKYGIPCFADDTGLEVLALNNEPGVNSARYAGTERSNENNMNLLLSKMTNIENRAARFKTVIAFISKNEEKIFEGIVEGTISKKKSGKKGFGYDPIFVPENSAVSFAEMSMNEKNMISHRGRAVRAFCEYLKSL